MRLHSAAIAAGYRLSLHEVLGSTNSAALDLARGGERGALWIIARRQTQGRGRRGSAWLSLQGNLHATLLLSDPAAPQHAPELSFVAGLAVHDAVAACAPSLRGRLAVKWPNDLLGNNAKLAGILIEGETIGAVLAVAIGIGVNCVDHPDETAYPATDLRACGADVTADDLFLSLSRALPERLAQWRRGEGFAAVRADWIARAAGIGGDLRVRLPDHELRGRCEALDEHGRLLLRLADGSLRTISAGDVFLAAGEPAGSARITGRVQ